MVSERSIRYAVDSIVSWTQYGVDAIRRASDEAGRVEELNWSLRHMQQGVKIYLKRVPKSSDWWKFMSALIEHAEIVLNTAKGEADYASATEDMVARAIGQGINPEVARRAAELQTAVRAARTDSERARRIRTLVMPLAKEAGDEAKQGHAEQSLHLIDQAMETLHEITSAEA